MTPWSFCGNLAKITRLRKFCLGPCAKPNLTPTQSIEKIQNKKIPALTRSKQTTNFMKKYSRLVFRISNWDPVSNKMTQKTRISGAHQFCKLSMPGPFCSTIIFSKKIKIRKKPALTRSKQTTNFMKKIQDSFSELVTEIP